MTPFVRQLKFTHIVLGLVLFPLIVYVSKGFAMSLFKHPEEEVVVSSPLEGKITFKGEPAAGAKVLRTLKWKDDKGVTDSVMTDADGNFNFPIVKDVVTIGKMTQFVMSQKISVYYNQEETVIWVIGKGDKSLYGELGGKPVNFRCELTDESAPMRMQDALLVTKCKWDGIKQIQGD